jgi:putative Mn2+ efflux pump MntP
MGRLQIMLLAFSLSMDAFAVALAAGVSGRARGPGAEFRISFHFGLFQGFMPILGWFLAYSLQDTIRAVDQWIAFVLLSSVGGRMIAGGSRGTSMVAGAPDPSRGSSLVALSVATSLDALAEGFTRACLGQAILWPSSVIGLTAALCSLGGMRLGGYFSARWGSWVERLAGTLLLGIGGQILVSHLSGA